MSASNWRAFWEHGNNTNCLIISCQPGGMHSLTFAFSKKDETILEAQKVSSCFYFTCMRRSGKIRTVGCGSCKIQIRAFLKSGI